MSSSSCISCITTSHLGQKLSESIEYDADPQHETCVMTKDCTVQTKPCTTDQWHSVQLKDMMAGKSWQATAVYCLGL